MVQTFSVDTPFVLHNISTIILPSLKFIGKILVLTIELITDAK